MKKKLFILIAFLTTIFSVSVLAMSSVKAEEPEVNVAENFKNLIAEYKGNGNYIKDTQINVDATKIAGEIAAYFHAKVDTTKRTTYYSNDALWMSRGNGEYSYYGTAYDGDATVGVTNGTAVAPYDTPEKTHVALKGEGKNSMEEYYVTLNDIYATAELGWTYDEETGVYTSTDAAVKDDFRNFVAPLWLSTEKSVNYIVFEKVTAQEVDGNLVLRIWCKTTDASKLVDGVTTEGDYCVFAEATIVKSFQLFNGGFESGNLDGWTKVGQIGNVYDADRYWTWGENVSYNKDGKYLFSTYADDNEGAHGYLKSSTFTVGSDWITFKLGAMKNASYTNFQIVDANTGEILKVYGNPQWKDSDARGCELVPYKANVSDLKGKEVYVKVLDYASSDYGCIQLDSVFTYYTEEPADFELHEPVLESFIRDGNTIELNKYTYSGYHLAVDVKNELYEANTIYEVPNAGFEKGNLDGWYKVGQIGAVTNADTYWEGISFNKDNTYLFSSYADDNEGARGYLSTRPFVVGGTGWITFKLGGGRNIGLINVQVIDSATNEVLEMFGNTSWTEADGRGCQLMPLKADISEYIGREVYIRVVDYATNNYGCFFFDSLNTYHTTVPGEEFAVAGNVDLYNVINGGFDNGNLNGSWELHNWEGTIGEVTDRNWYWPGEGERVNMDGTHLFNYFFPFNEEWAKGTLTSSAFTVAGAGFVTYKLGGAGKGGERDGRNNTVYVRVIDALTGAELKRVVNSEYYTHGGNGWLLSYKFDLREFMGRTVQIQFVDDSSFDYGCFLIDSLVTYYETEPDGFYYAENYFK